MNNKLLFVLIMICMLIVGTVIGVKIISISYDTANLSNITFDYRRELFNTTFCSEQNKTPYIYYPLKCKGINFTGTNITDVCKEALFKCEAKT